MKTINIKTIGITSTDISFLCLSLKIMIKLLKMKLISDLTEEENEVVLKKYTEIYIKLNEYNKD